MSFNNRVSHKEGNWVNYKLSDLGTIQTGSTPKTSQTNNFGNYIPFITPANFYSDGQLEYNDKGLSQKGLKGSRLIESESVLMVCIGATIGKAGFNNRAVATNQQINTLTPNRGVSAKFIYYQMITLDFQDSVMHNSSQATLPIINKTKWSNLVVSVPPLPEQKRIVAILDEAFAGISQAIANTEKNLANARELFESYLNVKLMKVASAHSTQKLSEISELVVDCEHKTAPTQDTGYPSIRTPNIGKGELLLDGVNRVSEETYNSWTRRAKPMPNDLILAREALAGNVAVIPEGEQVCLGQRTVLIRPMAKVVTPYYFAYLLLHPLTQKRLLSHSTGATVQHVNMKDIRQLPIGELPTLEEQFEVTQAITKTRTRFKELEFIYQQKLNALKELKQSILQKAFSGGLTEDLPL